MVSARKPMLVMDNLHKAPPLATHPLRYALLRLDMALKPHEVPQLRRFVNRFVGQEEDLFHNHRSEAAYHYRYPLVQYKSSEGKAALLGLADSGVEALEKLKSHPEFRAHCAEWIGDGSLWMEEYRETLTLHAALPDTIWELRHYIALNEQNLRLWHEKPGLAARAALLERCLTGHLLKFASAIRWQLPPHSLQVELSDYRTRTLKSFDNPFLGFELQFRTNLSLPEGIGLGKAVSHGFGVLRSVP